MTDLIARLRDLACRMQIGGIGIIAKWPATLEEAAAALAAQAQEIEEHRESSVAWKGNCARAEERALKQQHRAEAAEAHADREMTRAKDAAARATVAQAERDAIEAKTFAETRERCAQMAEEMPVSYYGAEAQPMIAAAIRALRHIGST